MATQVNKKFVIGLSAVVIVGALGVVGVGWMALAGRVEKMVAKGDAYAAAGDWEKASQQYERAVGHDRTRTDWLIKWRDAMVKTVPDTRPQYEKQYSFYRDILRLIAFQRPTDAAAQVAYVDEIERFIRAVGGGRDNFEFIIKECDDRMRGLPQDAPERNRIRRARALAMVGLMQLTTAEEQRREEAVSELRAVLEANPGDSEAAEGIVQWHLAEAARLQREGKAEQTREALDRAIAEADAFLKTHPGDLRLSLVRFVVYQSRRGMDITSIESAREVNAEIRAKAEEFVAQLAEAGASGPVDADVVDRGVLVVIRTLGRPAAPSLLSVVNRQLESNPGSPRMMLMRAYLLRESDQHEESLTQYQAVVDLPDPPLSLEGFVLPRQRVAAVTAQVNTAIQLWDRSETEAERERALKRAKEYRGALAARTSALTKDDELLADARIAIAENRFADAVSTLGELRQRPAGQSIEVMQLLAQSLELQNSFGEARLVLNDLTRMAPGMLWAHLRLGEVNLRLGNLEEARNAFQTARQLDPRNQLANDRLAAVLTAMGAKTEGTEFASLRDPVIASLMQARELRENGDTAAANKKIEELREQEGLRWDRRLVTFLAESKLLEGDREGAGVLVDEAIAAAPNEESFKRLKARIEHEDPVEGALAAVDASNLSELEKNLERFQIYVRTGQRAKAIEALDAAEKINPDEQRVVDYRFVIALADRDFAAARRIAQKAATLDVDQANGLLYQGRVELVEGNIPQAIATLERAVQANQFNPAGRRLLAQAYLKAGRTGDALDSYKRAYEGRPEDASTARDYAEALVAANRGREALKVLSPDTGILQFSPEPDLVATWLQLESRYGDRAKAIRFRENALERAPDDMSNAVALAQLYLDDKDWAKAEALIARLEASPSSDGFAVAMLRAMWHGRQGQSETGATSLRAYIDSVPSSDRTVEMYTGLAQYLAVFGHPAEAAAALEEGRLHQHPLRLEADRTLGDFCFDRATRLAVQEASAKATEGLEEQAASLGEESRAELQKSVDVYLRVIGVMEKADREAMIKAFEEPLLKNFPEDQRNLDETRLAVRDQAASAVDATRVAVIKRAAETQLRLDKPAEAMATLAPLAKATPDDLQLLMLQAACADAQNDRRTARQLFDRAVQLYPNEPQTFYQRAVFNSKEPALVNDVLQDLTQCVRLRPAFGRAWVLRFEVLNREGRTDDAFAVLRAAMDANPDDNELRATLVRRLAQAGRLAEAQEEALRAVEKNPDDQQWLEMCARAMASFGRWQDASDLYQKLFDKDPSVAHARALLNAMLRRGVTIDRTKVGPALAEFEKGDEESVGDLMLRARARVAMGQRADSDKLVLDAIKVAGDDAAEARVLVDQLVLLKQGDPRDVVAFLDKASAENRLNGGMQVVRLRAKIATTARDQWPELQSEVLQLERQLKTPQQRIAWYSLIGQLHYMMGEYELAEGAYRKGLEIDPEEVQLNNDLAYTLVAHLNRAKDAVPFAERAAANAGDFVRSTVLDTLGVALQRSGQCEKAIPILVEAVQFARNPGESAVAQAHLGQAHLSCADRESAQRALRSAEEAAKRAPDMRELYEGPMEALRKALE